MTQTFEQWRDAQGFPVNSTQEPLWRECWDAAQISIGARLEAMQRSKAELEEALNKALAHSGQLQLTINELRATRATERAEIKAIISEMQNLEDPEDDTCMFYASLLIRALA